MEWKMIRKSELKQTVDGWTTADDVLPDFSEECQPYRDCLLSIFQDTKTQSGVDNPKGKVYKFDLIFGRELYLRFKKEFSITESLAANDNFWIYLSIKVVPDIVFWRWDAGAHDRFYNKSRRIWLKTLWWYWHLSWQGNVQTTQRFLESNSTDEIVQLVERSSPAGYRVKLCRAIMKHYAFHCFTTGNGDAMFFRRLMKLNTARSAVVEPALYEGEEEGYVKGLYDDLVSGQ